MFGKFGMEEVPGAFGTSASFALRLGQTVFSSASLLFMCLDVDFYAYTVFCDSHTPFAFLARQPPSHLRNDFRLKTLHGFIDLPGSNDSAKVGSAPSFEDIISTASFDNPTKFISSWSVFT
ncbi:hypothetical protein Ahy_A01g004825 [Arachis hypogaea]|uniref:Uncharacterized protein n=1 Tax=Arachis hypogaea TaxID=3818 RepID=A0A445EXC4_ARAHY|nr:hypothetical protein Ahy_A01g004825 [Arachis hypogaea]